MREALTDATDLPLHVVIVKNEIAVAHQMAATERMSHLSRPFRFSLTNNI